MGDIYIGRNEDGELTHSARGTTWSKDGASYISRKKVNGKWVYTYAKPGHTVSTRSNELSGKKGFREIDYGKEGSRVAQNNLRNTRYFDKNDPSYNNRTVAREFKKRSDRGYSNYESLKRQSVSAQRNIEKDPRYKVEAKTAYLKNKASRAARKNVAKGKKKVSEILSRLRKSAAATRTEVSKKARAARAQAKKTANSATNKVKKKIQNAVSVKETAYITDVSTGKRRPAPTDLFDNTSNKKKYKKQAKAQRHTKRVIAREQAVGKVKRTVKKYTPDIKNLRSGVIDTRYRGRTVSKKVDRNNAGKKR